MAKTLQTWIDTDVRAVEGKSIQWLSEHYFFRDPLRPYYFDAAAFFAPADGIILYQKIVQPDEPLVEIKGVAYTLREALRDPAYARPSLVIGIFMTFYDVHVNRMPLGGVLSYKRLEAIRSYNYPMLAVENDLLDTLRFQPNNSTYLRYNERMVNAVFAPSIRQTYYVLQIADFDVGVILPHATKQQQFFHQNRRFSQIRYGSQVDVIVPLSETYDFRCLQAETMHVEAGIDKLIDIRQKAC